MLNQDASRREKGGRGSTAVGSNENSAEGWAETSVGVMMRRRLETTHPHVRESTHADCSRRLSNRTVTSFTSQFMNQGKVKADQDEFELVLGAKIYFRSMRHELTILASRMSSVCIVECMCRLV